MQKVILVTGATDGIGLETAKSLVSKGHHVLLHGRNKSKLAKVESSLSSLGKVESYVADLTSMADVKELATAVKDKHSGLDVVINNAGIFKVSHPITKDGLDVRFVVNTIAPYLLTQQLLPLLGESGRVVNLSSAAQSSVNLKALRGEVPLSDGEAYAQSKLALTMWSRTLGLSLKRGPVVVSVNPASFLGTKMVKDAYGAAGKDVGIGSDILTRAALSDEFANASGKYFDNDSGRFASPHPDALDSKKCGAVMHEMEEILDKLDSSS